MSNYPETQRRPIELQYGTTERSMFNFFNAVYAWMCVGLALTAVVAWGCSQSRTMLQLMYGSRIMVVATSLGMLGIAVAAQRMALRVSAFVTTLLFLLYAILMGALMSYILIIYKLETIGAAFLVTAGVFGSMSVFGYITKRDLTSIGSYCIMGLWALILASIVNVFWANSPLSWIVTYGVALVTLGIIAYQTQKLRVLAAHFEGNREMLARVSIYGALVLYISFINLLLSVLRIMGGRR